MSRYLLSDMILFEDPDYLVLNKPPLLATLADRSNPINLLKLVREKYPEATVGHRLDKETSGILIVAKNAEAYRAISLQFENRKVIKVYHAIVQGRPDFTNKTVDAPIEKLSDGRVRISNAGKPAQTVFNSINAFSQHTLVEARPITGRMHQIRIHLSHINYPICGDATYGGPPIFLSDIKRRYKPSKNNTEETLIKRFALHSKKIQFLGLNGDAIEVEAPYPKDFKALLNQLERNN